MPRTKQKKALGEFPKANRRIYASLQKFQNTN